MHCEIAWVFNNDAASLIFLGNWDLNVSLSEAGIVSFPPFIASFH